MYVCMLYHILLHYTDKRWYDENVKVMKIAS